MTARAGALAAVGLDRGDPCFSLGGLHKEKRYAKGFPRILLLS